MAKYNNKNGRTAKPPKQLLGAGLARKAGEKLVDNNRRTQRVYKELFGDEAPQNKRKPTRGY
jgi:hypothetical protein